jgi:hypothetical protein
VSTDTQYLGVRLQKWLQPKSPNPHCRTRYVLSADAQLIRGESAGRDRIGIVPGPSSGLHNVSVATAVWSSSDATTTTDDES